MLDPNCQLACLVKHEKLLTEMLLSAVRVSRALHCRRSCILGVRMELFACGIAKPGR
jgi:hypothetical protein